VGLISVIVVVLVEDMLNVSENFSRIFPIACTLPIAFAAHVYFLRYVLMKRFKHFHIAFLPSITVSAPSDKNLRPPMPLSFCAKVLLPRKEAARVADTMIKASCGMVNNSADVARRLRWASGTLFLLVSTSSITLRFIYPIEGLADWVSNAGMMLLMLLSAFLLYRSRQYATIHHTQEWLDGSTAPVVYLRPFDKDASLVGQVLRSFNPLREESALLSGFVSDAEQLAKAVEPIGPMVAIGRPGENLPKPGPARVYATGDEWQSVVLQWLAMARLVILMPGKSGGVRWELEQALATLSPERFLLFLRSANRTEYESLAHTLLMTRARIALPDFDAIARQRVSGFFVFESGWGARFLPLHATKRVSYKHRKYVYHSTLQPVFAQLGVAWHPLPVSGDERVLKVGGVVLLIWLVLLGLFMLAFLV
jgi:hypothetical protein